MPQSPEDFIFSKRVSAWPKEGVPDGEVLVDLASTVLGNWTCTREGRMIWNRVKDWRPTGDAAPEGGHLGREPLGTLRVAPRLGDAVIQPQLQLIRPPMSCHTHNMTITDSVLCWTLLAGASDP